MKRFLLLLISLSVVFSCIEAKEKNSFQIKGFVYSEDKKPLEGAHIFIDGTHDGISSGKDGTFTIILNGGKQTLTFTYLGYEPLRVDLDMKTDTIIDVYMKMSYIMADEVVVSSSRLKSGSPVTFTDIDKTKIAENNAATNIPYMLELLPSVVTTSENGLRIGNSTFRIRGTDASRINININGLSLNDPESQAVFWGNIPNLAGMSQSLQVQRGAGSSVGGNSAFGGGINLQTKSPASNPYATVDLSYGSFNTFTGSLALGTGLMKYGFSVDAMYTKWLTDGYIRNGTCDNQSLFLSISKHGTKSILKAIVMLGRDKSGITWEGTPGYMLPINRRYNPAGEFTDDAGNVMYYGNEINKYLQNNFQLFYSVMLNNVFTLNFAGNYVNGFGYYENYKEDQSLEKFGLMAQNVNGENYLQSDIVSRELMRNDFYVITASSNCNYGKADIDFGGTYSYYLGDHYGRLIWVKYNENIPEGYEWYRSVGYKSDANIFAKGDFQLSKNINLFADIQYRYIQYKLSGFDDDMTDLSQTHIYNFLNPKLGISYSFSRFHNLYFSAGIVNREPTRSDIKDATKNGGNHQIKAETLLDIELGYGFKPGRGIINANVYFMGYRDQLVPTGKLSETGYVLMENVPYSYRLGLELSGGMRVLKWLRFDANLTLSRNKILNYTYYVDTYDNTENWNPIEQTEFNIGTTNISFSPDVIGAAIVEFEPLKDLKFQLTGKYVGQQYFDNTSRKQSCLNDYFLTDFKASYLVKIKGRGSIEFQLLVNNIFNADYINNAWVYRAMFADGSPEYVEDGYFPQAGINLTGRIIIKI